MTSLHAACIPKRISQLRRSRRKRGLLAVTTLGLAGFLAGLLSGCSGNLSIPAASDDGASTYAAAAGNWEITLPGSRLSALAGSLAVTGTTVTGTFHPVAGTCLGAGVPAAPFTVSGTLADGRMSFRSDNFSGGTIAAAGALASDDHSLISPSIAVTGGPCAAPAAGSQSLSPRDAPGATAQQFQPVTGTYAGTLASDSGGSLAVTTHLSQPTSADSNGIYHLSGTATFADTSCIGSPVLTDATVSGNTLTTTYTDPNTGNTVSGTGTLSSDAQTLTLTSWTLSGTCGSDRGTGLLTRTGS